MQVRPRRSFVVLTAVAALLPLQKLLVIVNADNCANILSGQFLCANPTSPLDCCNERSSCAAQLGATRCYDAATSAADVVGEMPQCDNLYNKGISTCVAFVQSRLVPPRAPTPLLGEAYIYYEPTVQGNSRQCAQLPQRMTSEVLYQYGSDVSRGAVFILNNQPTSPAAGGARYRFTNMLSFNCTSVVISASSSQQKLYTVALIDAGYSYMPYATRIQQRDVGTPIHMLVVNVPARPLTAAEIFPATLPQRGSSILPSLLDINQGSVLFPYLMPGNVLQASASDFATTDDLTFVYEVYEQTNGPLNIAPLSGAECFAGRPNFNLSQFATKNNLLGPTFGNYMTVAASQTDRWMTLYNCQLAMQSKLQQIGLPAALLTSAVSVTFQMPEADVNVAFGNPVSCQKLAGLQPARFKDQIKTFILPNAFPSPPTNLVQNGPPYYAVLIVDFGPVPGTSNSLVKVVSAYPALLYMEKNVQSRSQRSSTTEVCAYQSPYVPSGEQHRIVVLVYEQQRAQLDQSVTACTATFRSQIASQLGTSLQTAGTADFAFGTANNWSLKASNFFIALGDPSCVSAASQPQPLSPPTVWSYEGNTGPSHWPQIQPKCGGQRQSPINIAKQHVVVDVSLGDLTVFNYDATPTQPWKIINNGHTAQISASFPAGQAPMLRDGGLAPQGYVFQQMHFHWGDSDNPGSEHLVNFRRLPAELHIVHMRSDYAAIGGGTYTQDGSGLAVLGVLLDIGDDDNEAFDPIIRALASIEAFNTTASLSGLTLKNLLPNRAATPDDLAFYRYEGSLTTPDCFEIVQWTVLQKPVYVSERQAEELQDLLEPEEDEQVPGVEEHIIDNFRHTQPLNGRVVTANKLVAGAV